MLIFTRRPNEVIRIGKHITVRVVSVKGNQVRIGVEAPKTIKVDRQEVYLRRLDEEAQKELTS